MVDSFTNNFGLVLQSTNSNGGTWGTELNNQMISFLDNILGGTQAVVMSGSDVTLTLTPQWQNKAFKITGTLTTNVNLILPLNSSGGAGTTVGGEFIVDNQTTGNFTITVKTAATGSTGVVAPQGGRVLLYSDTVNVRYVDTGGLTFNGSAYTFGAGSVTEFLAALALTVDVGQILDGGGSVILAGQFGQIHVPFAATINKWWVMADQSGSINVDILRANNAVPTVSMVGAGTAPNLAASQFASSAPASWTSTTLAKDDFIAFNVTGTPSSVKRVTVALSCTRTGP
jgi:hypothetical protein